MPTQPTVSPADAVAQLSAVLQSFPLDAAQKKHVLRQLVQESWPGLPAFSTLKKPVIEELAKATVSNNVVVTFKDYGVQKVMLMKAGTHYKGLNYEAEPSQPIYITPGGFVNLTETTGTLLTPERPQGEDPNVAAVRELEEEVVDDTGQPILSIDPKRLTPLLTKTISRGSSERQLVIGSLLELDAGEAVKLKAHVHRLEHNDTYRHKVRAHTINGESNEPEICTIELLLLKDIAEGKYTLLEPSQQSLFEMAAQYLAADRGRG